MRYLILILSILIFNLNPAFAAVSYNTNLNTTPPIERGFKNKQKRNKKRFLKNKRKPNKSTSKGKVTWLMIAGIICAVTALIFLLMGIGIFIGTGYLYLWFLGVFGFFGALAISSFILAVIYSKNVGVRGGRGGQNQGKATY